MFHLACSFMRPVCVCVVCMYACMCVRVVLQGFVAPVSWLYVLCVRTSCMYVCMYVCMHVCTCIIPRIPSWLYVLCVCMYVCMHVCTYSIPRNHFICLVAFVQIICMYVRMYMHLDLWFPPHSTCAGVHTFVCLCMYVCMHVYIYIYIYVIYVYILHIKV